MVPPGQVVGETWTLAGSPYCVTGDIGVSLLTIQPGVTVLIDGPHQIDVLSSLMAIGTPQAPITFQRRDPGVAWKGIRFTDNTADARLVHCIVEGANESGIRIVNSTPRIRHCEIRGNYARDGGGINVRLDSASALSLEIAHCRVRDNTSTLTGSDCNGNGLGNGGGAGVWASVSTGHLRLFDCLVSGNRSGAQGLQGHRSGAGLRLTGSVSVDHCIVEDNSCYSYRCPCAPGAATSTAYGAGIWCNGDVFIENTRVINNLSHARACFTGSGVASGPGIYCAGGNLEVRGSIVSSNAASGNGGSDTEASRGAVFVGAGAALLENVTITNNSGPGVRHQGGAVDVRNSVIYFNNGGGLQISGSPAVDYSCVQGVLPPGTGNISSNPVLGCNQEILLGSPCIDAGDPALPHQDACNPPALGGPRNDMGAHGGPSACGWGIGIAREYCAASPNSTGEPATIRAQGSLRVSERDFTLVSQPVPNQPGLFYFGPCQVQLPFGDGYRCVGGGNVRLTPAVHPMGNVATRTVDLDAYQIGVGHYNFQYWFRDPTHGLFGFNLSTGLEVSFAP